jgi:purine-binding chemotaxis protein CheW
VTAEHAARAIAVVAGEAVYGLPVESVQEVVERRPLTRAFLAPRGLSGVMNLRGEVLPVLDLSVLLGRPPSIACATSRIVVVRGQEGSAASLPASSAAPGVEPNAVRAGLLVDELVGLRNFTWDAVQPPPATISERVRELIRGVLPDAPPCAVLDVNAVLTLARAGFERHAPSLPALARVTAPRAIS